MSSIATKVCKRCNQELPIESFWTTDKTRGYRRTNCKECDKAYLRQRYARSPQAREAAKANSRKWAVNNPKTSEQSRKDSLMYKFGLTPEKYEAMRDEQGNSCALCGSSDPGRTSTDKKWHAGHWNIDHDHKSGKVRGLLCHKCNVRIGAYEGLMEEIGGAKFLAYLSKG